jgi:hypothetical protein
VGHFRFWHLADVEAVTGDVRYRGKADLVPPLADFA